MAVISPGKKQSESDIVTAVDRVRSALRHHGATIVFPRCGSRGRSTYSNRSGSDDVECDGHSPAVAFGILSLSPRGQTPASFRTARSLDLLDRTLYFAPHPGLGMLLESVEPLQSTWRLGLPQCPDGHAKDPRIVEKLEKHG